MNARHFTSGYITSILAVLIIFVGFAPAASAQVQPGTLWATAFFDSITGESQTYRVRDDAVLHAPNGDYVGSGGLSDFRSDLEESFTNLQFWTRNAAQAGDLVIVSFLLTGINTGAFQGLTANCSGIAVPGVAMLRLSPSQEMDEQVVIEQWISYDADMIASQISAFNNLDASVRPGCA